jgi:hypothetical protein
MGPRESVNNHSLADMSLLNVESRNTQLRLNHVFKIVNDKCPSYMKENFKFVKDVHTYNTRSNLHDFCLPKNCGKDNATFVYSAIKDWNALPTYIKTIQTIIKFKKSVKEYLLLRARK